MIVRRISVLLVLPVPVDLAVAVLTAAADNFPNATITGDGDRLAILVDAFVEDE